MPGVLQKLDVNLLIYFSLKSHYTNRKLNHRAANNSALDYYKPRGHRNVIWTSLRLECSSYHASIYHSEIEQNRIQFRKHFLNVCHGSVPARDENNEQKHYS